MIRPISRPEFEALAAREPYYRRRWQYQSKATNAGWRILSRCCESPQSARVLELGPYKHPLFIGSEVMESNINPDLTNAAGIVCHDARVVPWPFADKTFDMFVALQVFEHLDGAQRAAFIEVRRVARNAIISLPIGWRPRALQDYLNCHFHISHTTAMRWFEPVGPSEILRGNGWPYSRMLYVFENLL